MWSPHGGLDTRAGASLQTDTIKHLVECYFSPQVLCLLGQKLNIWREDIFFGFQQMFGVTTQTQACN